MYRKKYMYKIKSTNRRINKKRNVIIIFFKKKAAKILQKIYPLCF